MYFFLNITVSQDTTQVIVEEGGMRRGPKDAQIIGLTWSLQHKLLPQDKEVSA